MSNSNLTSKEDRLETTLHALQHQIQEHCNISIQTQDIPIYLGRALAQKLPFVESSSFWRNLEEISQIPGIKTFVKTTLLKEYLPQMNYQDVLTLYRAVNIIEQHTKNLTTGEITHQLVQRCNLIEMLGDCYLFERVYELVNDARNLVYTKFAVRWRKSTGSIQCLSKRVLDSLRAPILQIKPKKQSVQKSAKLSPFSKMQQQDPQFLEQSRFEHLYSEDYFEVINSSAAVDSQIVEQQSESLNCQQGWNLFFF